MRLSVAIVCRNSGSTIGRTLESVRGLADEIVAVDSGSTDGTIGLLESAGARVIRTQWKGYVATKQMALDACRGEWVLSLDSDESIDVRAGEAIAALIDSPGGAIGARLNRKVYYRDRPLNHAWQPEWRLRLVRRGLFRWAGLDPHDRLEPVDPDRAGDVVALAGTIRHDTITTFEEFRSKQAAHARLMAQSLAEAGARGSVLRLVGSPVGALCKQLVLKRAFLDGWPGIQAAYSTAYATAVKHAVLLRLTRGGGSRPRAGSPERPA